METKRGGISQRLKDLLYGISWKATAEANTTARTLSLDSWHPNPKQKKQT